MSTERQTDSATPTAAATPPAQGIDVGRLEKELQANWQSASGATDESGVMRVCVQNLIVYATQGEDRAAIDALLNEVTEHSPSRVLMLVADRAAAAPRLEAYVSILCQDSARGGKRICGEQITIEAGGSAVGTAASAIEPLIVPDVPAFLWWKDIPHEEDKLFDRLIEMSDRVIIDSLAFDHPHEDLLRLSQIIAARRQYMLASDINWGRLTSWRNLVASFWDVPDYRAHLDRIESVIIEYDAPAHAPTEIATQAFLVAGWLASRLKWRATGEFQRDGQTSSWMMQAGDGRRIKIEMRARQERPGGESLIAALTLSSAAGGAEFYVAVNQKWTKLETSAKIGNAQAVGRIVSYEAKTEGQRLGRELSLLSRDAIYEESVLALRPVLEAAQKS